MSELKKTYCDTVQESWKQKQYKGTRVSDMAKHYSLEVLLLPRTQ